ncbi:MAG: L-seryl-tRNA(Sec) selenium transferase [Chloroflexi bacterium]|nr:L-seryl-tRNA(Sec) selenium transferase [Chloroflexota bacterium]MCL5074447.1 L-seryl-tRNA(Sec) selenium transferase [Chloroflexota bacterium]
MQEKLRELPSVDRLLQDERLQACIARFSRPTVLEAAREVLEEARRTITAGGPCPQFEELVQMIAARTAQSSESSLKVVINATGVVIHTNLGRAPLSPEATAAMVEAASRYSNLEYDLAEGKRGSRQVHVERALIRLSGAEAALVVNNNAAAVLLVLSALARGKEVIISRGQLVEIGGGFRIPEVMRQSGAKLVEVGTTNRTYISDYEAAISPKTAMLLRVHSSNFRLIGFTHAVELGELAALTHGRGLLVVDDLGSGALLDTAVFGLAHEPMVQESIASDVDLVCFSGDKLLGGPQAGIIVGKRTLVDKLKKHPLARAVRIDKASLAGLEATLRHYLRGEALDKIPVWCMISMPLEEIEKCAQEWARAFTAVGARAVVIEGESTVGGGSLPGETLPTRLVALTVRSAGERGVDSGAVKELATRLRCGRPPLIGRIDRGRFLLDPRTVLPEQREQLIQTVRLALAELGQAEWARSLRV